MSKTFFRKTFVVLFFVISCKFIYAQSFSEAAFNNLIDCEQKAAEGSFEKLRTAESSNYNVTYERLEWTIDPDTLYIIGKVTMYFIPVSDLDTLNLDFTDSLSVDSIQYHASNISYTQPGNFILHLSFPQTVSSGAIDSVSMFYHGVPRSSGFGSFLRQQHSGQNIVWSLSEPYGARDWWPCKQTLNDKIDSTDIFITCPVGNLAGSNGLLVANDTNGTWVTHHWRHRYPIATYLIGLAVTDYVAYTDEAPLTDDTVHVLNYVFPEYDSTARTLSPLLIPAIQLYSSLFGDYPFVNEKYGHMQFTWGGGMEHQTMTSALILDFYLTSHELMHQWFGDKVTCGSWHDIWLNEGFATYGTILCYEFLYPNTTDYYWWKQMCINVATSQPAGSVYVDDTTSVSRIFDGRLSYRKAAYLLNMLRWKLGDTNFFEGLKEYVNDPSLAYSYARTIDLQHHLEAVSGTDLTQFFDEWFYGEGFPSYTLLWSQDENNVLTSALFQTTSDPTSIPFFHIPVPVRVYGEGDSSDLVFDASTSGETFTSNVPFKIDSVKIDPYLWLISANDTVINLPVLSNTSPFIVLPNITHDEVNIYATNFQPGPGAIDFYSADGKLRKSISFTLQILNPYVTVSISDLPPGMYFATIKKGSGFQTTKIIKY